MRRNWWVWALWAIGAVLAIWMNYGPSAHTYQDDSGECGSGAWKYDC